MERKKKFDTQFQLQLMTPQREKLKKAFASVVMREGGTSADGTRNTEHNIFVRVLMAWADGELENVSNREAKA